MKYILSYENSEHGFYIIKLNNKSYLGPPFIDGKDLSKGELDQLISNDGWASTNDKKVFYKVETLRDYLKNEYLVSSIIRLSKLQKFMNQGKLLNTGSSEKTVNLMINKLFDAKDSSLWSPKDVAYFSSSISFFYRLTDEQKEKITKLSEDLIHEDSDLISVPGLFGVSSISGENNIYNQITRVCDSFIKNEIEWKAKLILTFSLYNQDMFSEKEIINLKRKHEEVREMIAKKNNYSTYSTIKKTIK